jgi:glycosyltransferase involved in cell wall biosynthesis
MNEQRWLMRTISGLRHQKNSSGKPLNLELIIIDSGSSDATLKLLKETEGVKVFEFKQTPYFPGRAINFGVSKAQGSIIVILSAHCIPTNEFSICKLIEPIIRKQDVVASYGRQIPMESSSPDDARDLIMTFRNEDKIQYFDGFIHNAFAAYSTEFLKKNLFDESVKHVEDIVWGKRIVGINTSIHYSSKAMVYHHHGLHQHKKNKSFRASGVRKYLDFDQKIDCPSWLKSIDYKVAALIYGNHDNPSEFKEIVNKIYPLDCFCFSSFPAAKSYPNVHYLSRSEESKRKNFSEFLQECVSDLHEFSGKIYEVFILIDLEYIEKQYDALKVNIENVCEKGYDGSFLAVKENHHLVSLDSDGNITSYKPQNENALAKLCFGQFGAITLDALANIANVEICAVALQIETKKEIGIRYAQ